MIESLMANVPASIAGSVALVCLTSFPLFRSRSGMLAMQLAAGVAFATHYAFLGVFAASMVNVLGCVQTGAALFAGRSAALNRIGYALIPLMILAGIYFWTGPVSAFCVAAMGLIAIGRMQTSQPLLRSLMLGGGAFWILHDFMVGAWIALAADVGCWITGAVGLAALYLRVRVERRSPECREGEAAERSGLGTAHGTPAGLVPAGTG